MRVKYLALSLLLTLAACGQTPTGTAPQTPSGSPALLAGPSLPAAPVKSGAAALRPLALLTDPVVGWGSNYGLSTIPAGLTNVTTIAVGGTHSLALKNDGIVVGWGSNYYGETDIPAGLTDVKAIEAGTYYSLVLKNDGTVVGWGNNNFGHTTIPAGLTGVTAISVGANHNLALKNDGTVVGWGYNGFGESSVPAGLTGVTAIAANGHHSLALKNDGTVVGWGYDGYGETTIPAGLTDVKAIAAGYYHSLALKNDGSVVAWGNNDFGQATIPAGLIGVAALAAGDFHSLALKNDGTIVAWGNNSNGQTTVPDGLTGVTAIAAGGSYSLALHTTDTTPPVITANLSPATPDGNNGWYKSPVTVNWTAVDSESAISAQSGCDGTTLSADTTGTTLTCTATSAGGTGTGSVTVKVDVTKPSLAPTLSSAQPVLLGGALSVTPNATDATSGVASSSCTAPTTSTVGSRTVTCTATDNAGNTQTQAVSYTVIYAFQDFLAPVDNLPVVNTAKAGSAIPVKFGLGGNQGLNILAGSPTVTKYTCAAGAPSDDLGALPTVSNSGLQYDAASNTYTYVWKTDKSTIGCYQLNVKLGDGTSHLANFQMK